VAVGALAVLALAGGCRRKPSDTFLTYFNGEHLVSVRYPATWQGAEGAGDGVWYRHFQGPAAGGKAAITVTLLSGPTGGTLDQYAQSYLQANTVESSEDASRQGVTGKRWRIVSGDGTRRLSLLLLQDAGHVWGLFTQADAAAFADHKKTIAEMESSLELERPKDYTPVQEPSYGLTIRVPPSWKTSQKSTSGGNYLQQFLSPPLVSDKTYSQGASLTVMVEPAPAGGLDGYYSAVRQRLGGDRYPVLTHVTWRGGYVDLMRAETALAVTRVKRYYWTSGGRGYSIGCESREDVFVRVTRWCDVIASTLEMGGQPLPPEAPAAASPTPPPRPLVVR
jgi:hypothetical protein